MAASGADALYRLQLRVGWLAAFALELDGVKLAGMKDYHIGHAPDARQGP
jgi:hypothetical protein